MVFFVKKISTILLSIFLIVCLSFSVFATNVTVLDKIVIDIPSEYEQTIDAGSVVRYMKSNDDFIQIEKNPVNIPITDFQSADTNKEVIKQIINNETGANFESLSYEFVIEKLPNGHDILILNNKMVNRSNEKITFYQRIVFFILDGNTYSITHTTNDSVSIDNIASSVNNIKFMSESISTNTSVSDDSAVPPTESITSGTSISSPIESTNLNNDYVYEGETNISDEDVLEAVDSIIFIIGGIGLLFVVIALTVAIILIKKSKKKNIATSQNNPSNSHKNNK